MYGLTYSLHHPRGAGGGGGGGGGEGREGERGLVYIVWGWSSLYIRKRVIKRTVTNYRGITLLSCLGKLFTTVLNEPIKQYCDINEIIQENHTGFRMNYSTTNHIFSLKSLIDIFFKNKQKLFCAFVDYQKAFDTVWRKGLFYKLDKNGIFKTSKVFKIVAKMYEESGHVCSQEIWSQTISQVMLVFVRVEICLHCCFHCI